MILSKRLGVCALLALFCNCSSSSQSALHASIGMSLTAPLGLFDNVDQVELLVAKADDSTKCKASTGNVSRDLRSTSSTRKFPLRDTLSNGEACPEGGRFCSDEIVLTKDPNEILIFQVLAYGSNAILASGCTAAAVNSDPFYLRLQLQTYVPPASCGNGIVEPSEQCEGDNAVPFDDDPICDSTCQSKEILLSNDNLTNPSKTITNGPNQSKSRLALAFSNAPSAANPNPLHAVFQDTNFLPDGNGPEINYRQASEHFLSIQKPALLSAQIRLPYSISSQNLGFIQRARSQTAPSITSLSDGSVLVAYEDDRNSSTGQVNISLTPLSAGALPTADLVYVNTTNPDHAAVPRVAGGPENLALLVWHDQLGQRIRGRIWNSQTGFVSTEDFAASNGSGKTPRVAGYSGGWAVVWQGFGEDSQDIILALIGPNGSIVTRLRANLSTAGNQDQPDVAINPSGQILVTWRDGADIRIRRFNSDGQANDADVETPVNSTESGSNPAVASSSTGQDFFALAWQTESGQIRGRLASGQSGYLANAVDGLTHDFEVSRPEIQGKRSLPTVAVGGAGFIVYGWQDDSEEHAGIYGRRFPLP